MNVLFHRQSDAGMQETEGGFHTQMFTAMSVTDIDLDTLRRDLDGEVDRFTNVGSGWTITAILRFSIRIGQYRPLVGSSFIPTPSSILRKQAVINVRNLNDDMCFAWAVLSALFPVDHYHHHADRISNYNSHLNAINLTDIKFPTPINQAALFERRFPSTCMFSEKTRKKLFRNL